jgi:DeoR/GlpR family transcriptional regulator of sugar metabolism
MFEMFIKQHFSEQNEVITIRLKGRKKDIFDILCDRKRVSVKELSKALFVTEMTIRRDLAEMESQGLLKRYHGGAIACEDSSELPISQRMFLEEDEKRILGKLASKHLSNNMNVYIDSSSTCQFIIPHLKKFSGIKIITNSAKAVSYASTLHIPCFLIGGEYFPQGMCFVGSCAEQNAENINVDIAFFSALGMSHDGIISDSEIYQTTIRKIIMKNAKKTVFVFEKSKLGNKFLHTLCHKDDADDIIMID